MKEFLHLLFIEPFEDKDALGFILGILIWLCSIFLFFLISLGLYYLTDYCLSVEKQGIGIVYKKEIITSHTTTTFVMSGKVMVPITNYHDTEYKIWLNINNNTDDYTISEFEYSLIDINQKFNCNYKLGGLSNEIYINKIEKYE